MARNKRFNRRAEFDCQDLELYGILGEKAGKEYPDSALHEMWKVLIRNQFPDILPGSSIKEVYEESKEEYQKLFKENYAATEDILEGLTTAITGDAGDVVIFNPNSQSVPAPVILPVSYTHLVHGSVTARKN